MVFGLYRLYVGARPLLCASCCNVAPADLVSLLSVGLIRFESLSLDDILMATLNGIMERSTAGSVLVVHVAFVLLPVSRWPRQLFGAPGLKLLRVFHQLADRVVVTRSTRIVQCRLIVPTPSRHLIRRRAFSATQ